MRGILILAAACALVSTPAAARYRLIAAGKPVAVARSGLSVTPDRPMNRLGARPGRHAETWTLDGAQLNDFTFYGAIADNKTLFREVDKRDSPLPRFSSTMLIPDVVQLFEGSYRVAIGTSLMAVDTIEPAQFAGNPGFCFTYSFTVQGEEVKRQGEARGAVIGGQLYLMTFEAPVIHYFTRDVATFRTIADGARIVAGKKK